MAADGIAVGEVASIFLDSVGWRVESLLVRVRRDIADRLGTPRSLFRGATIEIPVSRVQSVGDAVVLAVRVNELRESADDETTETVRPPKTPEGEPPATHH